MADNTGTAALELLRFHPALAATYGFESALRARVERLDRFRHTAFPRVHAVEYLEEGDGLALVTTHTAGKRLSELLPPPSDWGHRPYTPRPEAHPAFASWLIREITAAVADLQAQGHDIAHGALTADRIVLTPERRVVVVEHVLGSALASLDLSADGLWAQIGVLPERSSGVALLDPRSDVVQIGLIALSVLLGRRITPAEYPARLSQLLDEVLDVTGRRPLSVVDPLRLWLEQALRTDGRGFRTAKDARGGLGALPDPAAAADESAARKPVGKLAAAAAPARHPGPPRIFDLETVDAPEPVASTPEPPTTASEEPAASQSADALDAYHSIEQRLRTPDEDSKRSTAHAPGLAVRWAIGFAALAAIEAVALGVVVARRPAAPVAAASAVPVEVVDNDGDIVLIDGRAADARTIELQPSGSSHTISVLHRAATAPPPVVPRPRPTKPIKTSGSGDSAEATAIAEASARARPGGLKLVSPIEIEVLEGDHVLGRSTDGPVVTTAGSHELEFVNSAVGYRTRQTVQIKSGQIVSLTLTPPAGRLSVNAVPWAQVWVDGRALGDTPIANVTVPAGEHEILFRHPKLGEQRQKAVVKSGDLTRVSATLGR